MRQIDDDARRSARRRRRWRSSASTGMPRQTARAADGVGVEDDHADDLAEAERRDRQVVAAQAQRRDADHEPGAAQPRQPAGEQRA